jgi:hypothetical protein
VRVCECPVVKEADAGFAGDAGRPAVGIHIYFSPLDMKV